MYEDWKDKIRDFKQLVYEGKSSKISSSDKICHACWMSCKRAAIRIDHADDARGVYTTEEVVVETGDSEPFTAEPVHENLEVPSEVASKLQYSVHINIFIPVHSRVCSEHRLSNQWSDLFDSSNSIRTFTLEQVEHVFSFVNAFKPYLNFTIVEGIQEIEDNIFFFWTGRSKQDFFTLPNEVPRIQGMHKGLLGLAALLIKMRTGESDVRLSTLLDVPRSTLKRLMNKSREILVQDFVPMHLGLSHISRESLMDQNLTIPNGIII
ncbi:hypothetical protein SFRURICE_010216 [Spodoptera frugiperda]|nr:hypothetical protein SFRURICE_010216 [Spodoptera frugiperda]